MSLFNRLLVDQVKISRLAKVADAFGGFTTSETLKQTNVLARIYGASGVLEIEIAGKTFRATRKMMVSKDQDIQVGDIITVEDGSRYIVLALRNYRNAPQAQGHHITVDLGTYSEKNL